MATNASNPFDDLLALFGGANPLAAVAKTVGQVQQGVSGFLRAVDNFNDTMEQLNVIAARVNSLLDDVEPPIRALMPQLTRTIVVADGLVGQLSGPIDRVAPGLSRLADTLSSPILTTLPTDLGDFVGVINDLGKRLQPLGQLAETAGGLFGNLRPFGNLFGGGGVASTDPPPPPPSNTPPAQPVGTKPAAVKPRPAKKPARATPITKKAPAKRSPR